MRGEKTRELEGLDAGVEDVEDVEDVEEQRNEGMNA